MVNGPANFSLSSVWWCYNGQDCLFSDHLLPAQWHKCGAKPLENALHHSNTVFCQFSQFLLQNVPKPQTRGSLSYALICPKLVHLYAILGAGTNVRILILLSAIYHDHFYSHIYIPGWWGWCSSRGECLCITVSITSWDEAREPEKTAVINLLTEISCYQMILVK